MRALTNVQFTMSCLIRSPVDKVRLKSIFKFKLFYLLKTEFSYKHLLFNVLPPASFKWVNLHGWIMFSLVSNYSFSSNNVQSWSNKNNLKIRALCKKNLDLLTLIVKTYGPELSNFWNSYSIKTKMRSQMERQEKQLRFEDGMNRMALEWNAFSHIHLVPCVIDNVIQHPKKQWK